MQTIQGIWLYVVDILGLGVDNLHTWQMALRAVIVYISALAMVRIGEKRFLGRNTAFDVILGIIFGSVVSRAITGSSPFFPTLAAGLALVVLHWLFAIASFHSDWFGTFVKGRNRVLVEDGSILWDAMQKSHISETDLMTALRMQAGSDELEHVAEARLERSGDISVIKEHAQPRILEVDVAEGVQTVRIRLD